MMLISSETMLTVMNNYVIFSYLYAIIRNIYYRANSTYCKYNDFTNTTFTLKMQPLMDVIQYVVSSFDS